MNGNAFRIGRVDVSVDCGRERKPNVNQRRFRALAAARTVLAAAMLLVAAMASSHAQLSRPAPTGDGTTQHFFTVEIHEGRVASAARQQFVAAFGKELASAKVSKVDIAASVDEAVRQLANWNGEAPLRFFLPRISWEVIVAFEDQEP